MQLPLPEFLESPPPLESVAVVWTAFDDEHRVVIVATLARLIAKLVAADRAPLAAPEQETDDA